jgi:hypothetical protein
MNVEVKVFDQSNGTTLKAYFSNRLSGGGAIHSLKYENMRIGGCGELTMQANRTRQAGNAIAYGNIIEVWTSSDDEALGRRYKGVVLSIETDYKADTVKVNAWGLWHQFEWQIVVDYIEGASVATIVDDVFDGVVANTYCSATPTISIASPLTLGDAEFSFQPASDIFKKLAEVQGGIDYGVDADGVFYFRDSTTTKRGSFQVGVNMADFNVSERGDEMYNDVYIKTKGLVSAGHLTIHEADAASISSYKKRSKVIETPEFTAIADAIAWGEGQVSENHDPIKEYSFTPMLTTESHFPYTGTITLVDKDGTQIASLTIEGVDYSYNHAGLKQKISAGNRDASFDAAKMFSDLGRKVRLLETSGISGAKIKHKQFDEFRQYVEENAMSTGRYNVFNQDMSDGESGITRTVEKYSGFRHFHWEGIGRAFFHTHVRCDSMASPGIIQTIEIPTGRKLDSLRVYYHVDHYGRYVFDTPNSLQDWYNSNCYDATTGGFKIDEVNGYLIGHPLMVDTNWGGAPDGGRGRLDLQPKNWTRELLSHDLVPEFYSESGNEIIQFRLNDIAGSTGDIPFRCWFNYKPGAPINYAEMYIKIGATDWEVHCDPYLNSIKDTPNCDHFHIASGADYIVALTTTEAEVIVWVYDTSMSLQGFITPTMARQTSRRFVIRNMKNSDYPAETGDVGMAWFEIANKTVKVGDPDSGHLYSQRIVLEVSRDAGTTWTSFTPLDINGYSYHDFDISGQPNGTNTIMIKATLTWPAILFGFGAAWGGD